MSSAKITLIGMQSYMKQYNKDLFELLTLPDSIDKETVTDNILLKGSEFEVIYSNPDLLHDAIGVFSKKWQRTFTKWVEALNIDYNPLENYDRIEDWTDTGTAKDIEAGSINKNQSTITNNNGGSTVTDDTTTNSTNEVSAYNTANFQNDSKVTGSTTGNSNTTNNFTGNEALTDNTSNNNTIDRSNNNIHTGRVHGNIGVTTSMQLLEAQLSIVKWNVIEHITDLFLQEFCIMVY